MKRDVLVFCLAFFVLVTSPFTRAMTTPEEETLNLSKFLRPISDERWKAIAGTAVNQNYTVTNGDNLWNISTRLFGDGFYWPKVWAINNQKITNPHHIKPGNLIAFLPGTGVSLPSLGIDTLDEPDSPIVRVGNQWKKRSQEWKYLPRQRWEMVSVQLPQEVDPQGFDLRNKITFGKSDGETLSIFAVSKEFEPIGEIYASDVASTRLSTTNKVYIEPNSDMQVGEKFTITREPEDFDGDTTGNDGYIYFNLGTVVITRVEQDYVVGEITNTLLPIRREDILIDYVEKMREPEIIEGPEPLEASIHLEESLSTFRTAQHKIAFVDRGAEDGVEPGMIFRAYQDEDQNTGDSIADQPLIKVADLIVIDVSEGVSTVRVLNSRATILNEAKVILLTDVTDLVGEYEEEGDSSEDALAPDDPDEEETEDEEFEDDEELEEEDGEFFGEEGDESSAIAAPGFEEDGDAEAEDEFEDDEDLADDEEFVDEPIDDEEPVKKKDELDKIYDGGPLTDSEKKELEQLEKWKENPQEPKDEDIDEISEDGEFEDFEDGESVNIDDEIEQVTEDGEEFDFELDTKQSAEDTLSEDIEEFEDDADSDEPDDLGDDTFFEE